MRASPSSVIWLVVTALSLYLVVHSGIAAADVVTEPGGRGPTSFRAYPILGVVHAVGGAVAIGVGSGSCGEPASATASTSRSSSSASAGKPQRSAYAKAQDSSIRPPERQDNARASG